MRKKKVLFVANHLTIGGVQKSLISALNAIDYEKNDVTLYLRKNRLVLLPYINKNANVIVNKDPHRYYRRPYSMWLQLQSKLFKAFNKDDSLITKKLNQYIHDEQLSYEKKTFFKEREYDTAIAYNEGYTAEFVMTCVTAHKRIIFFQSSTNSLPELHKRIMPLFDEVVVEHPDIQQLIDSWYPEVRRITVLENYTDYRFLRKMSHEITVDACRNGITLCTCARFSPEKGIDLAIEAARVLKEKGNVFLWYLLGDGPEMSKIQQLIQQYQLEDCIMLMGMQTNPYPYMAACDIYVQPSREEALSIAMLESQILCAPMVSTKTAGGLAMIKEGVNGLLTDICAESLATGIEKLIKDEGLRRQIRLHLESIDYSEEETRYKKDWEDLLEN